MRVVLIPRAEIDFRGNWDVLGLTATGSYDYVVDDVFVPESYTYSLLENVQQRGGAGVPDRAVLDHRVGSRRLRARCRPARARRDHHAREHPGPHGRLRDDRHRAALPVRARAARLRAAAPRARSCTRRSADADAEARGAGRPGSDPPTAGARGRDLRDARGDRRGALRLPLGRLGGAAAGHRPALPARPARRQPAHLRRQQHPHRVRRRARRRGRAAS